MPTSSSLLLDIRLALPQRRAQVRPAGVADLEHLRVWKNAHRASFFHKAELTPEDQARWFAAFSRRTDATMLLLEVDGRPVGCVGFRATAPHTLELFNLILGEPALARGGLMSAFYGAVERELARRGARRVHLVVLTDNTPALAFYARNGFRRAERQPDGSPAPEGSCALEKALA